MSPAKTRATRAARRAATGSEVPYFLGLIFFLLFTLGSVIIAQKITLRYVTREFPRVATANYRALQSNLQTVEARLAARLAELQGICASRPALPANVPVLPGTQEPALLP